MSRHTKQQERRRRVKSGVNVIRITNIISCLMSYIFYLTANSNFK